MGNILDLRSEEWFGDFSPGLAVHVIDSIRPINLSSLFGAGESGERIIIWDDGTAESLTEERKAWEALAVCIKPIAVKKSPDSGCSMILNQIRMNRTSKMSLKMKMKSMKQKKRPLENVNLSVTGSVLVVNDDALMRYFQHRSFSSLLIDTI